MQTLKLSILLSFIICSNICSANNLQYDVSEPNSSFSDIDTNSLNSLDINEPISYFQYQGLLLEQGVPVYGNYDLEFTLYDTPNDINLVTFPIIIKDVNVIDGHYNVELDFGTGIFDGKPRWLEIWSKSAGSIDSYIMAGQREKLSPIPYALYSYNSEGSTTGSGSRNSLDAADGDPTDAVYVDDIGRVGIGTTTPTEMLDIFGTVQMSGFKMNTGASKGYVLTTNSSGTGTWQSLPSTSSGFTGNGTTNYLTKFTSSNSLGISSIYETSDGLIGFGTTSPAEKLQINGNIRLDSGNYISFYDNNTRIRESSDDLHIEAHDDLYLNPDDDILIFPSGNSGNRVGIGTSSPSVKFEVQGGPIKATGGLIIETRTSDPSNPVTGQIWLRTDL
ncbi:MAG: hypothetical protein JXA96_07395 [Sedimentisphaerales bacterium]|nr:hypothetical protein [Sedimentisphaerales bacterium]